MAPIAKSLALVSALFAALSIAAPVNLNKRDDAVVWDTVTTVVWTTIDITTTLYPDDSATTISSSTSTSTVSVTSVQPTATAAAAPTQAVPSQQEEQVQRVAPPTQAVATTAAAPTTTAAPQVAPPSSSSSTTEAPQPTTTQVAAAVVSSSSSSGTSSSGYSGSCSQGSPCVGDITYYDTATSASAPSSCGNTNDGETEAVLALPVGIMTNADCGKTVTVTYNGVSKTGLIVDKCMGCDNTSIDLSRFFFGELADLGAGRISGVSWYIN